MMRICSSYIDTAIMNQVVQKSYARYQQVGKSISTVTSIHTG
jgi:hypothetical protein